MTDYQRIAELKQELASIAKQAREELYSAMAHLIVQCSEVSDHEDLFGNGIKQEAELLAKSIAESRERMNAIFARQDTPTALDVRV